MRDALLDIVVAGRKQRLQVRESTRPTPTSSTPKAPPFAAIQMSGKQEIQQRVNRMTLPELRDQVQREDDRIAHYEANKHKP
eukprot:6430303-Amphidinium_carterae.1